MKNVKNIFLTTILLTASSFAMKTVGVWFNVYLSTRIGSAGIGLWNLILSVYFMLKTVAAAGMNLVSTRLVIDEPDAVGPNLKKLYMSSLVPGIAAMLLLFFGADIIANNFIQNQQSASAMRLLALSLPFVAMSACTGGYSTAKRKMARYALIQMLEQAVRIGVSIAALGIFIKYDLRKATLAAAAGITVSEMFSFLLGMSTVVYDRRKEKSTRSSENFSSKLKRIAVPDAAGSIFRSLLSTVQNLLIPHGMKQNGASAQSSLAAYGAVHGMALPVLLYPSSILGVLSGLLVPEIAQSKANNNTKHINYIVYRVLHLALIFSLGVTGAMLGFSGELSMAVYDSFEAQKYMLMLAPLIPVMYMDMTSDGLLKGLDMQKTIMKINVLDSVVSVIMIYFLVPKIGIYGYIVMVYFTELMNFFLSFGCLIRRTKFKLSRLKAVLPAVVMMPASILISRTLCRFMSFSGAVSESVVKISICTAIYIVLCFCSGSLTTEQLTWFKKIFK